MRKVSLLLLLSAFAAPCFASDIYFGPTSAGSNNGADCADAYAYNDATHGINGAGTASWVAGNTLHLCGGTWNGSAGQVWVAQPNGTSGSAGNPITIKFETGAIMSAPYHAVSGAISLQNSYIVVDGGTNGVIQNTTNGTNGSPNCINGPCSTQQPSVFVYLKQAGASNIEVKNLTMSDVYVQDSNTNNNDTAQSTVYCVFSLGNSNVTLDHNTCHDAYYGFAIWGTNTVISSNTLYNNGTADIGSGINAPVTGLQIDHNSMVKSCNWYTTSDAYHLNNVHIFANAGTGNYGGIVIYDNYFAGGCLLGAQTAHLYFEGTVTSAQIFNNIFDNQNGGSPYYFPSLWFGNSTGDGWSISNPLVVNNTFIGSDYVTGGSTDFHYNTEVTGLTFQNNLVTGGKSMLALATDGGGGAGNFASNGMNNNAYDSTNNGGSGNPFSYNQTAYATFALYKAALPVGSGQESASIIDPLATLAIHSDGTLRSGSPAIGLGINLTSLGIAALDTGAPQTFGVSGICGTGCVPRPPGGAWDAGAYEFTGVTPPNPPQNLNVTAVH